MKIKDVPCHGVCPCGVPCDYHVFDNFRDYCIYIKGFGGAMALSPSA